MAEIIKKIGKVARKVGFTAYDVSESFVNMGIERMREQRKIQDRENLYDLTDEELVKRAQTTKSATEKLAINKELSERHDEDVDYQHQRMEDYRQYEIKEYLGLFIDESKKYLINVKACTERRMEFSLAEAKKKDGRGKQCSGVFWINENILLCSGIGYTFKLEWYGMDEFEIKGKIPWVKDDVNLYFERATKENTEGIL